MECLADLHPPGRIERRQKIVCLGVAERMAFQVRLHAPAEGLRAHPMLEHADDGGALVVGDAVEGVLNIALGFDGLADAARRGQAVFLRGGQLGFDRVGVRCHSGFHSASSFCCIQVAKASFNQTSFHHSIVTESPNHWCASS